MRGSAFLLAAMSLLSLVAFVPSASAVATCTAADNLVGEYCPGLVCIGYTGGQWQRCYLSDEPCTTNCIDLCRYMDNCVILRDP